MAAPGPNAARPARGTPATRSCRASRSQPTSCRRRQQPHYLTPAKSTEYVNRNGSPAARKAFRRLLQTVNESVRHDLNDEAHEEEAPFGVATCSQKPRPSLKESERPPATRTCCRSARFVRHREESGLRIWPYRPTIPRGTSGLGQQRGRAREGVTLVGPAQIKLQGLVMEGPEWKCSS